MLSLKKEDTAVVNALGQRIWRLRLWSNSLLGDIRQIVSDASLELFPHLIPVDCSVSHLVNSCYSVAQLCPALCDAMDCSTPGFPVLDYLPELAQTHVH